MCSNPDRSRWPSRTRPAEGAPRLTPLQQEEAPALAPRRLVAGEIVLDLEDGSVRRQGRGIAVTVRELALLRLLMEHAGRTVRRDVIEDRLYCWGQELGSNAIDVHIHALRRKLGASLIETQRGVGFRIRTEAAPAVQPPGGV